MTSLKLTKNLWGTRKRRVLTVSVLAFVLYSIVGFLVLPALLKWQLPKQLSEATRRETTVRQVRVNPWALSLRIRGFEMKEPDGALFAGWDDFYVNFQASSLFRRAWTFKEILLAQPVGSVILKENGEFNFSDLLSKTNAPAETNSTGTIPGVIVFSLNVTNGAFRFEDRTFTEPFQTEYREINLHLIDLTTRPGLETPYSFHAESGGKILRWAGDITVQPFSSRGLIEIQNATPGRYQAYLANATKARITEGTLTLRSDYFVSAGTNGFDAIVTNGFLRLTGFKVEDPEAGETVFSLGAIIVEGARANLRERVAGVQKLVIEEPGVLARLEENGELNLARLAAKTQTNASSTAEPATNGSAPWTIELAEFALNKGSVHFEDRLRRGGFGTKLQPIELSVKDFSTAPDAKASYQFAIATEAAEQIRGAGTLSVLPVRSDGELAIAALQLPKYKPYFADRLRGDLSSGELNVKLNYQVEQSAQLAASISNLVVTLAGLTLKSADSNETLVSMPEFAVEGGSGNLHERTARVDKVRSSRASILVRREKDGAINLLGLLAPAATNEVPSAQSTEEPGRAWQAVVDLITLDDYAVRFEDRQLAEPAVVNVDQVNVKVAGAGTDLTRPVEVALGLRLNETGLLSAEGTTVLSPVSADVGLSITNVDLRMLQPYVQEHLRIGISNGVAAAAARLKYGSGSTNEGRLTATGGVFVNDLATLNLLDSRELVSWTNLAVTGIEFEHPPPKLAVAAVHWDGLKANLLIDSNGQMNVKAILPQSTNSVVAAPAAPPTAGPGESTIGGRFPLHVELFALTNAHISFADASMSPPVELPLGQVAGTITGLSSAPETMAAVNLSAQVGEQAPLLITGRINPLAGAPQLDLVITNRNLQLPPLSGYMEKFTGYPLLQGRLTLGLKYEVANNGLKAQNRVQIDRLTLGQQTSGTNATKLPLKLAVALLKDPSGQIALDVPLSGRLDDPQFRIGPAIAQVTGNLITKAVASPFKLLGAAVGAGEELSYVEFIPGSAEFAKDGSDKIAKLAKALQNREGLNLEIQASIDPDQDRSTLARSIVRQQMKEARLAELKDFGQAPENSEPFELEPAELRRLLRAAVAQQIGTNLAPALEELAIASTEAISTAAEAAPKQRWYKRLTHVFSSKDSPQAAARRRAKADAELIEQNPQLATLSIETMERLLATRVEVPPEKLVELMKARIDAVRAELLKTGSLTEDRLLFIPPKPPQEGYVGQARVDLSLS